MKHTFVKLPTGSIEIEEIREVYTELRYNNFIFTKWFPRPALVDKNGKTSWLYTGQKFDSEYIELVNDGWTHDHCQICSITISNIDNEYSFSEGYFDSYDWVCKSCHDLILKSENIEDFIKNSDKVEKEF